MGGQWGRGLKMTITALQHKWQNIASKGWITEAANTAVVCLDPFRTVLRPVAAPHLLPPPGMTKITKLLSPAWLTFDDLSHTQRLISEPQRHCLFQTAAAICHYWECRLQTQCLIIRGRLQSTSPRRVTVWLPANYQNRQQASSIPHQTTDDKINKCVSGLSRAATNREESAEEVPPLDFCVCLQALTLSIRSHTGGGVTSSTYQHQHRQFAKKKEIVLIF